MIPISARTRESELLETRSFRTDTYSVEMLEDRVAEYHGRACAVAFNTPESALKAVFSVLGLVPGERIVQSALGPLYHYTAADLAGLNPHYIDINLDGSFYKKELAAALDQGAKAAVHHYLSGIITDSEPLPSLIGASADLITDASASLAPAENTDMLLWSLQEMMPDLCEPTGFVLTDDTNRAQALKTFRAQGKVAKKAWNYDIVSQGCDGSLSALSAAVALIQMASIRTACALRQEHAAAYDAALNKHRLFDLVARKDQSVLQAYPVLLSPALYCPKEEIFSDIRDAGVETDVCCKPVYKTTRFKKEGFSLRVTEDVYRALLQLPCHHRLTAKERGKTIETFLASVETYGYRGCSF